MKVSFDSITVKKKLLDAGTIEFQTGDIVLIKGKNGTGKSTLIHNLQRKYLENAVLIAQSNNMLLSERSVLENIALSNDSFKLKEVEKYLEDNQLEYLLERNINALSGGEKRLICILRGIVSVADYIMVDEPTNDLDYNKVQFISMLIQSSNKTFIIVSHDDRMEKIANCVYEIRNEELCLIKQNEKSVDVTELKLQNENSKINNEKFIIKTLKRNWVYIFASCCFLILSIILLSEVAVRKNTMLKTIRNNQVDIYIDSNMYARHMIYEGYDYPLASMFLDEGLFKYKKRYRDMYNPDEIRHEFYLSSNDIYEVYPVILIDTETYIGYDIFSIYLEKIHNQELGIGELDVSQYFDLIVTREEYTDDKKSFDMNIYQKIRTETEQALAGHFMYEYVILLIRDGYTIEDVLTCEEVKALGEKKVFIRCKESIDVVNMLRVLIESLQVLIIYAVISCMILIFSIILTWGIVRTQKKKIKLYFDYGNKLDIGIKNILRVYATRKYILVSYVNCALVILLCGIMNRNKLLLAVIMAAIQMLFMFILFKSTRLIVKRTIRKVWIER